MANTESLYRSWRKCNVCLDTRSFKCLKDFSKHLRDFHCTKEGGSFICRYGAHGLCSSLPIEGVSDKDYEDHILKDHMCIYGNKSSHSPLFIEMISQIEPNIIADQHKWTVYNSRQNLSAVLNDPRKTKRETDFFTKTWGDSFVERLEIPSHPSLPEINRSHFENYLKDVGKRFKRKAKNSEIKVSKFHSSSRDGEIYSGLRLSRSIEKQSSDLEQVPKIFLQSNFNLENPEIFQAVFGRTQFEASSSVNANQQSSKLLQEKLSHYLDIVEVQIAEQISLQSEAFFHAMTSHDKLQDHLTQTYQAIKHLRGKVNNLDQMLAKGSLQILKYKCSYDNAVSLFKKLKLMSTVHQTQPTIQLLLSTSEFVGALDLISTTQEVLTQELAGIHSFRHLSSQLIEMEKLIDKMMHADFIRYATSALNRPLTEPELVMEEERLVAIVFGMLRQHKFVFVDIFKEESLTAIKAILKQTVVEVVSQADDIDVDTQAGSLSDQMRSLSFPKWLDLLSKVFDSLLIVIHRVKAVFDIMSDVINIAAGKAHSPLSPAKTLTSTPEVTHMQVTVSSEVDLIISENEYNKLDASLKEMLCIICDHTHDRTAKLLSVRARDGCLDKLTSCEFVSLSRQIELFAIQCEEMCGRKSSSLCAVLQTQANRFVNKFHEERKTKLSLILDNERWKQADVPTEFQDLVDHITSTGKLAIPPKIISEVERKSQEYLIVSEEKYAVVGTVLMLLKIVVEYAACSDDIPSITADLLIRLIDIIKIFNSRTCQLILGAGALQLVGLKTITTKNLALASRCLQLMVHYIPIAKSHFETRLNSKHSLMLKYFDQILKDYQDHIEEILKKFISIMEAMFFQQLSKYEVKAPVPSSCFRNICKQMIKFHEAIIDLLPQQQIMSLFIKVNSALKKQLRLQLAKLNVNNDGGPQHGLVTSDLVFYLGHVKSMTGMSSFPDKMDDIWEKKGKPEEFLPSGSQAGWPS